MKGESIFNRLPRKFPASPALPAHPVPTSSGLPPARPVRFSEEVTLPVVTTVNILSRRSPGPGRPGSTGTGGGQTKTGEAEGRVLRNRGWGQGAVAI